MAQALETALKKRCEDNPALAVLQAQWEFDRQVVARGLQTIAQWFPHYSRHDASHSLTILVQIERILGPARIARLSATDLWLLLEAAFLHDIGMVVPDHDATQILDSDDFRTHLEHLARSTNDGLAEAAKVLRDRGLPTTHDWPLAVRRAVTLALADFVRRRHAGRSEEFVRSPHQLGLSSPRTGLIPGRLFGVLGRICAAHGASLDETLLLPREEAGLATETAHPRFIAAMLRLGDLLDLDNDRFCPVLLASFGVVPLSSRAHILKHAAIRHFNVTEREVVVDADCGDGDDAYEGYVETDRWLRWLEDELKGQMARWAEIAPEHDFGALPSPTRLEVKLGGDLVTLERGKRPRFDVDRDGLLRLVRGANLYDTPAPFVREVLQNAIDATLLRAWLEKSQDLCAEITPTLVREALDVYPIDFEIVHEPRADRDDRVGWKMTVRDRGIGISQSDLRWLLTVGSSRRNSKRRKTITAMPSLLQPAGVFGIGLQSLFLITDVVEITTHSVETGEVFAITMHAPEGLEGGNVIIRSVPRSKLSTPGTNVSCICRWPRVAQKITLSGDDRAGRMIKRFDPIAQDEFPYDAESARATAEAVAQTALVPIRVDGHEAEQPSDGKGAYFWCSEESVQLWLEARPGPGHLELRYRGSPTRESVHWVGIYGEASLLFGQSDDLLLADRDHFREEAKEEVRGRVFGALKAVLPRFSTHVSGFSAGSSMGIAWHVSERDAGSR